MTAKDDIRAELVSVADTIGSARDALAQNQIMDIRGIQHRVREVANAITDLDPEEAVELRTPLTELLSDFKGYAEELRAKIDEIQTAGGVSGEPAG